MAVNTDTDWAALGVAGLGILGGAITARQNRKHQNKQNQLDRDWEFKMYQTQRQDALSDWRMMNEYNSPGQQMRRLQEAGLNPHLVYGKGADNTAGAVARSTATPSSKPSYNIPTDILPNAAMGFMNARLTAAQTDNVNQMTAVQRQEELLKAAQTAKTLTDNARGKFDLGQAEQLQDQVILRAKLENENLVAQTEKTDIESDVLLNRDAREELANSTNVTLTLQKILTEEEQRKKLQLENAQAPAELAKLKAEIANIEQMRQNAQNEGLVKAIDAKLYAEGYDRRDPIYSRLFMMMLRLGDKALDLKKQEYEEK